MSLEIRFCNVGSLGTNCYILTDDISGESLVVDPGMYDLQLKKTLENNNITSLKYILLTHGHYDHILGVEELQKDLGGKIVIHEDDSDCFVDGSKSLSEYFSDGVALNVKPDVKVVDGSTLNLGDKTIKVIHTPGHTNGSVCFLIDNLIFSGDTLFKESVGRTDFPTGDMKTILKSVQKLKTLNGDYKIYPGHGEFTTLNYEKNHNYYMR